MESTGRIGLHAKRSLIGKPLIGKTLVASAGVALVAVGVAAGAGNALAQEGVRVEVEPSALALEVGDKAQVVARVVDAGGNLWTCPSSSSPAPGAAWPWTDPPARWRR